jgi:hypothetical protein
MHMKSRLPIMIKRIILLASLLVVALPTLAQDSTNGGQFWVQSFEDRNANGTHDPGEPFLTRGVSVDLLNADGVVMASGTLDDAPFASRGFIGFLYLAPGSYTAVINSPDLTPTTPDRVAVTITQGAQPVTALYGAQRAAVVETIPASGSLLMLKGDLGRVALAGFGALVVVGVMAIIGLLIYLLVLRRRAPAAARRTTTGSMRPVQVYDTGEIRRTGEIRQTGETIAKGDRP